MPIISSEKNADTLLLTLVAEFPVDVGRVWQLSRIRDNWSAGGARRAGRPPSIAMTSSSAGARDTA
jgi:hypothetical protein